MSRGAARCSSLAARNEPTAHRPPPTAPSFPSRPFWSPPVFGRVATLRVASGRVVPTNCAATTSSEQSRATRQTTVHQRHPTTSARAPASHAKVIADCHHLHPHIRGPSVNGAGALLSLRVASLQSSKASSRRRAVGGYHPPRTPPTPLRSAGGEKTRCPPVSGGKKTESPLRYAGGEKREPTLPRRRGRHHLQGKVTSTRGLSASQVSMRST